MPPAGLMEITALAAACVVGGMIGTRMKYHSRLLKGEKPVFDRQTFFSGLYVAGGAGLVTALLGQGIHVNRGVLIGTSIVVGYAGGPRFFDWLQKMIERISARRLLDGVKEAASEIDAELKKLDADSEEESEEKPP